MSFARRFQRAPNFILGHTKPLAVNSGLNVSGTNPASLTTVGGNITHSTDSATFNGIRFTGHVTVTGKNITYRNCWFNAPADGVSSLLVNVLNSNVQNAYFENCLFKPSSYAPTTTGSIGGCIMGHDFTLYRCDLSGGIDLISVYSGVSLSTPAQNINILGCYMHDQLFYSPDAGHLDNQSHSDGVQVHGGTQNFLMRGTNQTGLLDPAQGQAADPPVDDGNGNHLSGNVQYPSLSAMSCFMLSPVDTTAGVDNFVVDHNWLGGGAVIFNWPRSDGTNIFIINNRWTRGSYLGDDYTVLMDPAQAATITGNYYDDTRVAWNGRKNG